MQYPFILLETVSLGEELKLSEAVLQLTGDKMRRSTAHLFFFEL